MSSGQKPRWPEFFPKMKRRGNRRPSRFVVYDSEWNPQWPPSIGGVDLRSGKLTFQLGNTERTFNGMYWEEMP